MEAPILKYSDNRFYFVSDSPLGFKIPGAARAHTGEGTGYVFSNTYPTNLLALKTFKKMFQGAKASSNALNEIKKVKEIPKRLEDLELTTKYQEVFEVGGRNPFPYQVEDVESILQYNELALLLEQGLGKTYIALMALAIMAKQKKEGFKAIVLAPRIVLPNWMKETKRFTHFKPFLYRGDIFKRLDLQQEETDWDILITNYETLVDSPKITGAVLFTWWERLPMDKRKDLLYKNLGEEYIHLVEQKSTKKYRQDVARALRKIPERKLFNMEMYRIKQGLSDLNYLKEQNFDCVILDEGSRVKGAKANRSHAVKALVKDIPRRYILSGTLCLGDPRDVFMPMNVLNDHIFGSDYYHFKRKYTVVSPYNKHVIVGFKNLDDLKRRMAPYIVERKREDNLALPERIVTERYYELSKQQIDLYNRIIDEDNVQFKGETINTSLPVVKINKLLQVLNGFVYASVNREELVCGECERVVDCVINNITPANKKCLNYDPSFKQEAKLIPIPGGDSKLELLKSDLSDLIGTEKAIIWVNYKYDMERIKEMLGKTKINFITPETPDCALIFEEAEDIRVFLGQVKQGIGITLNSATTTIYYSHTLDLEARLQSMDRNYRIGQKKPVVIRDYIGEQSIEHDIVTLMQRKEQVKTVLQSKPQCAICTELTGCTERKVELFSPGCKHYSEIKDIENKKKLFIRKIKNG